MDDRLPDNVITEIAGEMEFWFGEQVDDVVAEAAVSASQRHDMPVVIDDVEDARIYAEFLRLHGWMRQPPEEPPVLVMPDPNSDTRIPLSTRRVVADVADIAFTAAADRHVEKVLHGEELGAWVVSYMAAAEAAYTAGWEAARNYKYPETEVDDA